MRSAGRHREALSRPPSDASSVRGGGFRLEPASGRPKALPGAGVKAPQGCPETPSTLPKERRRRTPWIAVSSSAPGGDLGSSPEPRDTGL